MNEEKEESDYTWRIRKILIGQTLWTDVRKKYWVDVMGWVKKYEHIWRVYIRYDRFLRDYSSFKMRL